MSSTLLSHLRGQNLEEEKKDAGINRSGTNVPSKDVGVTGTGKSYVHVVEGNNMPGTMECDSISAIVLDDECLYSKHLSKSLLGRVKEFASLSNLKTTLMNEGNTFKQIAAKWGELLDVDYQEEMCFHSKRLCLFTKSGWVPDFLDDSDDEDQSDDGFKDGDRNVQDVGSFGDDSDLAEVPKTLFEESMGQKEKQSEDQFGFTPNDDTNEFCRNEENVRSVNDDNPQDSNVDEIQTGQEGNSANKGSKDYFAHVINQWDGEVVTMGDFNKVRYKSDRFGLVFNVQGADVLNSFIASAGLKEVPLGGNSFTWCHKSATKMSKLDRFLISENLLITCPNISATTLDRYLSDHRLILLRETQSDDTWSEAPGDDSNAMRSMMRKLKYLKVKIQEWNNGNRNNTKRAIEKYIEELEALDAAIDKGNGSDEIVNKRMEVINSMHHIDKIQAMDMAQKAKIKWSIKRDENSRFFHGVLNKKRSQLNIRGMSRSVPEGMSRSVPEGMSRSWDGEVVTMGDFNKVRYKSDWFGLVFNVQGADVFNSFIANACLKESDDGPVPFRLFHHWTELEGFNKFVIDTWSEAPGDDSNAMRSMMRKLKYLKVKIQEWNNGNRNNTKRAIEKYIEELEALDAAIDKGNGSDEIVNKRMEVINSMHHIDKIQAMDMAQKAKIK
nr:RNA-directed DNA polymerase, eukaryota [Tanacetum cinerariifolium]